MSYRANRDTIEDAEWLAEHGETLRTALERLGITRDGLWAACKRAGRLDVYRRLSDRETGSRTESGREAARRRWESKDTAALFPPVGAGGEIGAATWPLIVENIRTWRCHHWTADPDIRTCPLCEAT